MDVILGRVYTCLLAKEYGSIYTLYFESWPTMVFHEYKAVKEALINRDVKFLGRGHIPMIDDAQKRYGWRSLEENELYINLTGGKPRS
ncbi:cytochrome P450 2C44-like [Cebus imitator]|uniref:cytochrome P450 2C44-like n=1 Tax=Cebus imitator TaxID=2715852 RepID=UPI00189AC950|nr:cytochrome P450 2C44-like [Cebus imitator]